MVEHLEEASYLYETRFAWLKDPELTWVDVAELEERLETHVDAMVVGQVYMHQLIESNSLVPDDIGQLFALVCFCCRIKDMALLTRFIKQVDPQDEGQITAFVYAFRQNIPEQWIGVLETILNNVKESNVIVLTNLVACIGRLPEDHLEALLAKVIPSLLPLAIRCQAKEPLIGRIPAIAPYLQHTCPVVKQVAALSIYHLGKPEIMASLPDYGLSFALPIALLGTTEQQQAMVDNITIENLSIGALIALGIIGSPRCTKILLTALALPDYGQTAAQALALIFGVGLRETVFVKTIFEKDELFEDEYDAFERGQTPKHPSGKAYGENLDVLSQDSDQWRQWLKKNYSRFNPQHRYRLGEPYSSTSVCRSLYDINVPYMIRQWIYDELIIRFKIPLTKNVESPVVQQAMEIKQAYQNITRSMP